MADSTERALPSLVADDLVDLSRRVTARHPVSHEYGGDDGPREEPLERPDGLAVAFPYAILELLVEIRDALVSAGVPAIAQTDERPDFTLDLLDLEELYRRIARSFDDVLYLDSGRALALTRLASTAVVGFLREKGIAR